MKALARSLGGTLLAACIAGAPLARAGAPDASFGEHGMALFGGKAGLYAAHLPMFHAPHDYQVILQLRVADAATDAALRERLDGKTALWTIAPEKFALDRLAPDAATPLRRFTADLVLGHFEQGGERQYAGATLIVDKVLLYRRLSPQAARGERAHYLQIGAGTRRFLVKQIDSRPDYDHIVAITTRADAPSAPIWLAKQALRQPDQTRLAAALAPAKLAGTIYFSTDDLK